MSSGPTKEAMGPLKGVKVIEVGGIGAGPFCAMMLADLGADIIRVDRKGQRPAPVAPKYEILQRGRRSAVVDVKKAAGVEAILKLVDRADVLFECYRPGVMERLGLGPDVCLKRNPKLVYGRITGWGQDGPLAHAAGHDINYIALTGALHAIGRAGEKPAPPLNLVGDYGGGGMLLALGIACALCEAGRSGKGQVVDAAMLNGAASLMSMFYGYWAAGIWKDQRGVNILDGGAHFYDTYETACGKWVAIGAIEPQFYALLLELTGVTDPDFQNQWDMEKWPKLKEKLASVFKTKTRDEWCEIMEGTDVCFAPVLSIEEAAEHPHNIARKTFVEVDGVPQPAPALRFSRTRPEIQCPPAAPGEHTEATLAQWGFSKAEIESLAAAGAI